jgi:hypothetical protein
LLGEGIHNALKSGRAAASAIIAFDNGQADSLRRAYKKQLEPLFNDLADPPPLKWSDLRYVFDIKEDCNGKEAIQA